MIGSITMLSLFSIHFINLSGGEVDGEGLTVLLAGDDEAAGQVLAPAAPTIPFLKIWLVDFIGLVMRCSKKNLCRFLVYLAY